MNVQVLYNLKFYCFTEIVCMDKLKSALYLDHTILLSIYICNQTKYFFMEIIIINTFKQTINFENFCNTLFKSIYIYMWS
jgi:hypothetical protein